MREQRGSVSWRLKPASPIVGLLSPERLTMNSLNVITYLGFPLVCEVLVSLLALHVLGSWFLSS